jgi:hypothetical protein
MFPSLRSAALVATVLALGLAATSPCAHAAKSAARASAAKPASGAHAGAVVPFIEDDWTRALAEAKQRNLPLVVESWAPW